LRLTKLTDTALNSHKARGIKSLELHAARATASHAELAASHAARHATNTSKVQSLQLRGLGATACCTKLSVKWAAARLR